MTAILFICLGNICRSPMAEFVMRDLVDQRGLTDSISIASAGTSSEESGNPVHRGTVKRLASEGISCAGKTSRQLRAGDYAAYDYLVVMEQANMRPALRILGGDPEGKVSTLLSYTGVEGDIADPYYTGNFDDTYRDVLAGCTALLDAIEEAGR